MPEKLLSIEEAAIILRTGVRAVERWCQQGRFRHVKKVWTGRKYIWKIPRRDVNRFNRARSDAIESVVVE